MKNLISKITRQTEGLRRFISGDILPDLDEYAIAERPRRNVQVKEGRQAKGQVLEGTEYVTQRSEDEQNVVETVKANRRPDTPSEVVLDEFDIAYLDDVIGSKWRKNEGRAKVIKWYWLNEYSAAQIEVAKTDKQTKKLESGYSERTVAGFIKAFYEADDERAKKGKARQRASRFVDSEEDEEQKDPSIVVEW